MADSELERVFVTFLANDKDLEKTYQQIVRRSKEVAGEVAKAFDTSVSKGFTDAGVKVQRSARQQADAVDEVEAAFKALRNETAALRNTVEAGDTTNKKAIKRFNELQEAALHQARGFEVSSDEYRKFTQVAAQASRSVATLEGRTTKLGFSANAAVGITAAFNQNLARMGPAGNVAGTALGIVSQEFRALLQLNPRQILGGISASIGAISVAAAALAAAAVAGVTVALFKMGVEAAKTADEIDKASQSAGFGAEAFQEVAFALEQTGVGFEQVRQGLNDFNARLGQAAAGSASIAQTYKDLGVAIRDGNGQIRDSEEVFTDLINALSEIPSAAEQAAKGGLVFGEEFSRRVIPALNQGAEGFQELRDRARDLGLILSGDAITSLVEFKDSVAEIQKQFQTARIEIVAAFIPIFNDLLLPLLQNTVVPALQGVAQRVRDFSQAFLDTGPAGAEFRAQMLGNIQPLLSFGDVVIGIGQGFLSFVQLVLGGAAGIGAALGELSFQVEQFATGMANITEGLAWWQQGNLLGAIEVFKRAKNLGGEVFDPSNITAAFDRAAGEYLDRSLSLAQEAQERLARGLSGDYSEAFNRLTESIQGAIGRGASSFTPALTDAVNDAVGGGALSGLEQLPEGSLAALRASAQAARRDFELAVTDEARTAALERVSIAEAEIAAIEAVYARSDPLAPARAWVGRLAAELEFGLKNVDEVFALISPRAEELREEAAAALSEFGFDSAQYQDAVAKLGVLEGLLARVSEERKVTLTLDASATVTGLTQLFPPDVVANVLDVPLKEALFAIHAFASDASDDFTYARESWDDFSGNVALGAHQVATALEAPTAAARLFADTIQAMIASGASVKEIADAIDRSPLGASLPGFLFMSGPGGESPAAGVPVLQAALDAQAAAWADVQAAMTEEQLEQAGLRHQAATAEVERLKEIYGGATLPTPQLVGDTISGVLADLGGQLRTAEAAALAFGDTTGLAAEKQALLESAIRRILALNPAADVQDLVIAWEMLAAQSTETASGMDDMGRFSRELAAAQTQLARLTGDAPDQWESLRVAFLNAAAAGKITVEQFEELLATIRELETASKSTEALNELAGNINLGAQIGEGLTSALEGIRDGDIGSVLSGLTDVGAAIGTAIGGPAVGALVQAIGSAIQAIPALFQAISDLFTGDSPARRELAASLTQTVENAIRTGINAGLRGTDDWRDTLRNDIRESVVGALVDAFIEAAITQAIIAPFIDEFTRILNTQGREAALAYLDANLNAILSEAEGAAADIVAIFDRYYNDIDTRTGGADPLSPGTFELPTATVSVLAAPQWALELNTAAVTIGEAGTAMLEAAQLMQATFQAGITVNSTSSRGVDAARAA